MDVRAGPQNSNNAAAPEFFSPDDCLITSFRRALANQQNIRVSAEGHGSLVLLSTRGEYFADSPDLPELLQLPPDKCRVTIVSEEDSAPYANRVGRNIDELMWQTAFHVSKGRLMEGCSWNDVVQLDYWPNLTRLPLTPDTFRSLALFYQHPTSIFFASRLLKVPAKEMYQIYSAARAAGFARPINRKPEEPRLEPHRNQTLLSSLLGKLSGR